jgi:uroporphyrin-III C-methyltransferase/precorrin-2 dehydrogenase/sirohydrochlorin ferrochelatase
MDYFPIFLRLTGEPVLVVGGGLVAARKIELLQRAGARVTVVAPEINPEIGDSIAQRVAAGQLVHLAEEFRPQHLHGMRLVIAATDKHAVNAWVAHHAERDNVPVNVVDDRELSRFIMPAIVDRSPVLLAVASSGDAPVLTRRLREKLEALLPARLGRLASLAGKFRRVVRTRLTDAGARRRFWERFFDGPVAADVLAGRADAESDAVQLRIEDALRDAVQRSASLVDVADAAGEVALVGAGPGDPSLLTLRGLRALQNADVVLYDRLVSNEVLELARRDAQRLFVGKMPGQSHIAQSQINALLVDLARSGKRVCRLKGGDPFIFGRGGEELEALAAAGIRFEVVPGITAAAGCAAYAGIPLTHREHAQMVTFVTGHCQGSIEQQPDKIDWELLARPRHTAVFYMGLAHLEEIVQRLREHGAPGERPAALIEQGTQATQRVITATLAGLVAAAREAQIAAPALLIVGDVTRLHATLQWFNATSTPVGAPFALTPTSEGRLTA